jgi:release factor glutamine methyltransferase
VAEPALELTRKAAQVFEERGFPNARLEAELLLAGALCVRRLDLYLQHDRPVAGEELERYRTWVRRRLKHEPLQYILGTAAFRKLELHVDPRVLIPRPETEVLVGEVLAWAGARSEWGSALDVGTGSGAIALNLAHEGRFERVVATDASQDALDVARENAQRTASGDVVEFRCGSLYDPLHEDERFTVIVSNPPYVGEGQRDTLTPEVRDHEPSMALFAGADGLTVIHELIDGAPDRLESGGLLALEIGLGQADAVVGRIEAARAFREARVVPDLTRRPRIVVAVRT